MKLPNDSIGISDILQYGSCPSRFEYGMQRHTGREPPEATNENNAYGSAVHEAIHLIEVRGLNNEEAITEVWTRYGGWLDPEDLEMLKEDLDRYRRDAPLGMELLASEREARVPLFTHEGRLIYFRFKIDAIYRRTDEPGVMYMRDYKSSKWPKTEGEVHRDPQMWAYNWAVFELYPECHTLTQSYEQLRYGNHLTSKNAAQREQMRLWLIENVRAILTDETLEPKKEQFCAYCPLVLTCDVTRRSVAHWRGVLSALAPMTKEGRKTKVTFMDDAASVEEMIALLPSMIDARKHIERVEKELKGLLEKMPSEQRDRLGWRLAERHSKALPPAALQVLHEALGDTFYEAVTLSRTRLERIAGKEQLALARDLELEDVSATSVLPAR